MLRHLFASGVRATGTSPVTGRNACPTGPSCPTRPTKSFVTPQPRRRSCAPADAPPYAELDAVTNFSFLRGASHPDELVLSRRRSTGTGPIGRGRREHAGRRRPRRTRPSASSARRDRLPGQAGRRLPARRWPMRRTCSCGPVDRRGYADLCQLITTGQAAGRARPGSTWRLGDVLERHGAPDGSGRPRRAIAVVELGGGPAPGGDRTTGCRSWPGAGTGGTTPAGSGDAGRAGPPRPASRCWPSNGVHYHDRRPPAPAGRAHVRPAQRLHNS